MFNMKQRSFTPLLTVIIAFTVANATPSLGDLFETSFESGESPSYALGTIFGLNGWQRVNTTLNDAGMIIEGVKDGSPGAPDGTQMLRLTNAKGIFDIYRGAPYACIKIKSLETADQFSFSGVVGFSGDVSIKTGIISRFYLSNSEKSNSFLGPAFGIWQERNALRFFYTKAPRGVATSFGDDTPVAGKLYRVELDVNVPERSYRIRVYDLENNTMIASADDGRFRNDTAIAINYLRLNNQSNPSENGDDFISYFDDIKISTTPLSNQ